MLTFTDARSVVEQVVDLDRADGVARQLMMLLDRQSNWSQETFGYDRDLGPLGCLKHIKKECDEAIAVIEAGNDQLEELADIFLLLTESTRRSGYTFDDLLLAAIAKHCVNENRVWPHISEVVKDEPTEHIRDNE